MPRGRGKKNVSATHGPSRRSGRTKQSDENVVPAVYQEMLAEAAMSSPIKSDGEGRTIKRRRVGEHLSSKAEQDVTTFSSEVQTPTVDDGLDELFEDVDIEGPRQIIYDDFADTDSDDDEEFEDINIEDAASRAEHSATADLNISLQPVQSEKTKSAPRRKPVSKAERRLRLDLHKMHVLCLLAHVRCRSDWCNDLEVQAALKTLLPRKIINLLHVDDDQPQYQRTHSWTKGIEECCKIWEQHFEITTRGLRRAWWREEAEKGLDFDDLDASDNLSDKDDFLQAARTQAGSRDVGAQLFCALLRSVAVDTRLVCSLQVLPFSGVAKGMTPEKPKPDYILATDLQPKLDDDENNTDSSVDFSNPRRRIGQPQFSVSEPSAQRHSPAPRKQKKKKIVDSPFPVFWVEAFNEASQKWIPLDPLVRHTINKPKTGFEPPASDRLNNMSYVISFEEDGTAKDVTRRYARHYNAKTRKTRIESTKGGVTWWKKTMSFFEKTFHEDRDEIEDAELAAREAAEEMPRNVQDFKDHPHYALERHLRRNEVIWPLQEVGKVSPGMGKDAKLEPIYRRQDVHIVRSADQWYRLGRDVNVGEQPLKRAAAKRKQASTFDEMDEDHDEAQEGTRLYAEFQTDIYIPPPVVKGRVPKNAYGNIDIYVPTMIPPDGIHVQHPESARAAKTLGIDFAAAVTGFEFKGRQGTAVIKGIVIAAEYHDAIVEVLRCFNDEKARAIEHARTVETLRLWKKLLVGLRVQERIKEYEEKADDPDQPTKPRRHDSADSSDSEYIESPGGGGGGFFAEDDDDGGGGFIPDPGARDPEPAAPIATVEHEISARADQTLSAIDLDAGIVITASPHPSNTIASQSHARPSDPSIDDNADDTASARPPPASSSSSPSRTHQHRQQHFEIRVTPSRTAPGLGSASDPVQAPSAAVAEAKEEEKEVDGGGFIVTEEAAGAEEMGHEEKEENEDNSSIEKGSLLSSDPEDRDADPEWLD